MTGARSRFGGIKAVMTALAILYATAALAVLATATRSDVERAASRPPAAQLLELGPLGR